MLHNQSRDPAPLVCSKAAISYKRHRLQPELGHGPLPLHMDVRRFPAVGTEENEAVRSLTKYGRHKAISSRTCFHTQRKDFTQKREKCLLKPNAGTAQGSRIAPAPALALFPGQHKGSFCVHNPGLRRTSSTAEPSLSLVTGA